MGSFSLQVLSSEARVTLIHSLTSPNSMLNFYTHASKTYDGPIQLSRTYCQYFLLSSGIRFAFHFHFHGWFRTMEEESQEVRWEAFKWYICDVEAMFNMIITDLPPDVTLVTEDGKCHTASSSKPPFPTFTFRSSTKLMLATPLQKTR